MTSPSFSEEKLTAYALGELPEADRREIEAELAANPELQKELRAIQTLAAQLRAELSAEISDREGKEDYPPLKIDEPIEPGSEKVIVFRKHPWLYAAGLLAAAACAALMILPSISMSLNTARKSPVFAPPARDPMEVTVSTVTDLPTKEEMPEEVDASPAPPKPMAVAADQLQAMTDAAQSQPSPTFAMADAAEKMPVEAKPMQKSVASRGDFNLNALKIAPEKPLSDASGAVASTAPTLAPPASVAVNVAAATARPVSVFGKMEEVTRDGYYADVTDKDKTLRRQSTADVAGESYEKITDNPFQKVAEQALSTFSIDVDTGSYTNLRRFLNQNQLPPKNAVRIEELVNYFNYDYPQPKNDDPFSVTTELARAPWKDDHLLVRIGLQGKTVAAEDRPAANLVFLIDVSGSMNEANKLPLVVDSMKLLVKKLKPQDRVGIAVYAGNSGMVLPSTLVSHRGEILDALSNLHPGGSTNGAMGIQLAYDMAKAHFIEGGINRVILCTDGDFNVGITDRGDLLKLIEEKAKSKVFLSVFGFGMGNLQDATLEQLADKGNGNYGYIDNAKEAKRVFVEKLGGTLQTIAKDVKIQVEFNPAVVSSYRLIGYENRMLAAEDFNNDKKDAGEIGSGHRVTALYELVPVGVKEDQPSVDPLKYQKAAPVAPAEYAGDKSEIMNVKLRYKQPEGEVSKLIEHPVKNESIRSFTSGKSSWWHSAPELASDDFQFAAGVAAFGMVLRESPHRGNADLDLVLRLSGKGASDRQEDRTEFIGLVKKAKALLNEDRDSR